MLAHFIFETAAYLVGFTLFRLLRRRGDVLEPSQRWSLVVAAILGAAVGSKLLHHLGHPAQLVENWRDPVYLMGGKTILGGLLGGWLAVEAWKKRSGITQRTGDLYVLPLIVGMMIGRVGCFLAGLDDDTYGIATASIFGVDFGDGIPRHPTQLYEIVFLALLGLLVARPMRPEPRQGERFRGFILGYVAFRFGAEFLKPVETVAGLGVYQWTSLAVLAWNAPELPRLGRAFVAGPFRAMMGR